MQIKTLTQARDVVVDFTETYPDLPAEEAKLNIKYNTAALTPNEQKKLSASSEEDFESMVELVCKLVLEWDLMEGKKVVPLTKESLMDTPFEVLGLALKAVSGDIQERAEAEGKA